MKLNELNDEGEFLKVNSAYYIFKICKKKKLISFEENFPYEKNKKAHLFIALVLVAS